MWNTWSDHTEPRCRRRSRCRPAKRCGRAHIAASNVCLTQLLHQHPTCTTHLSYHCLIYNSKSSSPSPDCLEFIRPAAIEPCLIDTGRRRKIRCIFAPDNPDVCSECFARGSRCIDQEHANPEVVVDHRKNLRERVSRLEALVDTLLDDKTVKSESRSQSISQPDTSSPKAATLYSKENFPVTPLTSEGSTNFMQNNQRVPSNRGHHVPILSVLEDAVGGLRSTHINLPTDVHSSMMLKRKPMLAIQVARQRYQSHPLGRLMIASPSRTGTRTTLTGEESLLFSPQSQRRLSKH